jgi:solute carrier family 36 (proton-coupled amino acid transporter)
MVLVTFGVAFLVPNLGLLISLIGAICSTSLALVFPVMIELLVITRNDESPAPAVLIKDCLILLLAIIGFFSGGYESLRLIVKLYENKARE